MEMLTGISLKDLKPQNLLINKVFEALDERPLCTDCDISRKENSSWVTLVWHERSAFLFEVILTRYTDKSGYYLVSVI